MKCDNIKLMLMDFLYDEISTDDRRLLKSHLSNCTTCREEYLALKETSGILREWEEIDSNLNIVFVSEKQSLVERLKDGFSFSPKKIIYGFALGFASVILIFSLVNMEISYDEGDFSLKMSIFPPKVAQTEKITPDQNELMTYLQKQNLQMMNQLIQQSERRQQQQLMTTLARFSRDVESRRTTDLRLVGAGLDEIEKSLYMRLERKTNDQLNNFIRYINENQGGNRK